MEEFRKKLSDGQDKKSPHEKKVAKFVDYLNAQLLEIPPRVWFNFTVECMELVDKYTAEEELPSFSTRYNPYNYHSSQGAQGSSYGYQNQGHSSNAGMNYSRRSHYAAVPRQYSSHSYGGSTCAAPSNEPLQAASAYNTSHSINTTPISPPLAPSGNVAETSGNYSATNTPMYSQLTAAAAGKSLVSSSATTAGVQVNTDDDDILTFNEQLFE